MVLVTGTGNKIKRILYSKVLWIFILNSLLILIPVSGMILIRSRDYQALNIRSMTVRELSRSIISFLEQGAAPDLLSSSPVIAPWQRILLADPDNLRILSDSGWRKNDTIASFEYELPVSNHISRFLGDVPDPELEGGAILERMTRYIQSGEDKFSIIDYRFLYSLRNFQTREGRIQTLILLVDKSDLMKSTKIYKILLLMTTLISLLTAFILSTVYFRLLIKPLTLLTEEALRIKETGEPPKVPFSMEKRVDEIGLLSRAFSITTRELVKSRESLEDFTADILHELKNPLTGIRNGIEILNRKERAGSESREMLSILSRETGRIEKLLYDIREYSLSGKEEVLSAWSDPTSLIEGVLSLYAQWDISCSLKGSRPVKLPEDQFISLLTNLLDNAVGFSPVPGSVSIEYTDKGTQSFLTIRDEGPGIPLSNREKIYKRFYSCRKEPEDESNLHSGLGLSIVWKILTNNGHAVRYEENSPRGAVFILTFNNA